MEDEPDDLRQFCRDLPDVFSSRGLQADLYPCDTFEEAERMATSPLYRFDLIISDTYRGPIENLDADALHLVEIYRGGRFCPLVLYSSGVRPPDLVEGPFLRWADKGRLGDIERAIREILDSRVPQMARQLHDELDGVSGTYLWGFLEAKWDRLNRPSPLGPIVMERMIRRRAAIQLGDIGPASGAMDTVERAGAEYYIYPPLNDDSFNLGDVLRHKERSNDLRVIMTPHCHLVRQPGQMQPRADHVLTLKVEATASVLGEKLDKAKALDRESRHKKLRVWSRSPAQTGQTPEGRHWYLPGFLDIPHAFCDFLQAESLSYETVCGQYDRIATLAPPFAEALQSCFTGFYASVGIPAVKPESIESMLE
jgi:hypothetical protein